jgi:hypothetical protein
MLPSHSGAAEQRFWGPLACLLAIAVSSSGCLYYGYGTEVSVTPLTDTAFPPTSSVELHFRALTKDDTCTPVALIEVAGSNGETTAAGMATLKERAAHLGADAIFSVTASRAARTRGDAMAEALNPDNDPDVYSSRVVSGIAVRCDVGQPSPATQMTRAGAD